MTRIEVPNSSLRPRTSRRLVLVLALMLLAAAAGFALWTWITLSWSYSDGERAGIVQKFSRRGWICKTEEGELALFIVSGIAPQIWYFSVRDAKIAEQINASVGRRVQLHYTEHPGVPTNCFADTPYYVDRVTVVDNLSSGTR
jgi:hypothetical protein